MKINKFLSLICCLLIAFSAQAISQATIRTTLTNIANFSNNNKAFLALSVAALATGSIAYEYLTHKPHSNDAVKSFLENLSNKLCGIVTLSISAGFACGAYLRGICLK